MGVGGGCLRNKKNFTIVFKSCIIFCLKIKESAIIIVITDFQVFSFLNFRGLSHRFRVWSAEKIKIAIIVTEWGRVLKEIHIFFFYHKSVPPTVFSCVVQTACYLHLPICVLHSGPACDNCVSFALQVTVAVWVTLDMLKRAVINSNVPWEMSLRICLSSDRAILVTTVWLLLFRKSCNHSLYLQLC